MKRESYYSRIYLCLVLLLSSCCHRLSFAMSLVNRDKPPIILLPGTAQSRTSWQHQISSLERERQILFVDTLTYSESSTDISLPAQARHVYEKICADLEYPPETRFDLAGFSLGGRIAMAFAILYPDKVRKLFLTGVSLDRSSFGMLQLMAWKDLLKHGNVRGFGWSAVLASYSPDFLMRNQDRISGWIDGLCSEYEAGALLQQLEQTQPRDDDEWSVRSMAEMLNDRSYIEGRICVGADDRMAPLDRAHALVDSLGWSLVAIENAGHSVAIEDPLQWRVNMLEFFQ